MAGLENSKGYRVSVCARCVGEAFQANEREESIADRLAGNAEDRYSAGVYAGHYCEKHWAAAGYRKDLPHVVGGMSEDEIEAFDA